MNTYNRKDEIIKDIFQKKCHLMWSNTKIKAYLVEHYGYTPMTAQKYCEDLWQLIRDIHTPDYETDLNQAIEFLEHCIATETNSFTKLQYAKELNKIKGLHISKVQIDGQINNIQTIKLVQVLNPNENTEQLNPMPETKLLTEDAPFIDVNSEKTE